MEIAEVKEPLASWLRAAYELGAEDAESAATWVTDANEPEESKRRKLKLIEDGDPLADDYLPAPPNLSGEWADDRTPQSLATEIAGEGLDQVDDEADVIDLLCTAYENGVAEHFMLACEFLLKEELGEF